MSAKSEFLKLGKSDWIRGLYITVGTQISTVLLVTLNSGKIPTLIELKVSTISGVAAGLAYILKNLFTNSNNEILKKEAPKASE
jgi:hypothetical protein